MSGPRARVVVLDPLHPDCLAELDRRHDLVVHRGATPDELPGLLAGADAVVVRSGVRLTGDLIAGATALRVIARAGTGTDNLDLDAARRAGVTVFTVPGRSGRAVAELAVGLMLAAGRRIALADRQVRANVWRKAELSGPTFAGRTLGVVGLGAVGSEVARLGTAFGMRVTATVAHADDARRARLAADGITLCALPELLAQADVVVLAVPSDDRTRGLVGAAELAAMRPEALLVNVARGDVVDEAALRAALDRGDLAGAGLDVHAKEGAPSPLADCDAVVLTPHIGAMSDDVQRAVGEVVLDRLDRALRGEPVEDRVC